MQLQLDSRDNIKEMTSFAEVDHPHSAPRAHKPHGRISDQQKRRDVALDRQKNARKNQQIEARRIALHATELGPDDAPLPIEEDPPATDEGVGEDTLVHRVESDDFEVDDEGQSSEASLSDGLLEGGGGGLKGQTAREFYSKQLTLPEWLIDIPNNLAKDWFVMVRPEGQRCLVIASCGTTVSRLRNGRILHRFPSALPNGARTRQVAAAAHVYCILDCIFHEPDETYYVVDIMAWRGHSMYDCSAEFRFFWLASKLAETTAGGPPSHFNRYRFQPLSARECSVGGIRAAYSESVPFVRDGLLLYNRHAHYTPGLTPLVLLWKDAHCSPYLLDTDANGEVPPQQQLVLEYRADGTLGTGDNPPTVMGRLPDSFVQTNAKQLQAGTLLRFAIGGGGLHMVEGQPLSADLQYQGMSHQRRGGADSCTKILFQYAARHNPIAISDLVNSIEATDGDGDVGMGGGDGCTMQGRNER